MEQITEQETRIDRNEIARLACSLWEQDGRQPGRDWDYWLQAERQLQAARKQNPVEPKALEPKLPALSHPRESFVPSKALSKVNRRN